MENTFDRNYSVTFVDHRCAQCGTFWAIEKWKDWLRSCPHCGGKEISRYREEIATLHKAAAGLKGQITKLKKK